MREEVFSYPLNPQASVLVDAQTDIKLAIKQGVLGGKNKSQVKLDLERIIDKAVERIRSPTLKGDSRISLMKFADSAYKEFVHRLRSIPTATLLSVVVLMRAIGAEKPKGDMFMPRTTKTRQAARRLHYTANNYGVPLQEFSSNYMSRVNEALEGLAESVALDTNDTSGRNSLRNLAEMQVRYEKHQDEIQTLERKGVKLVVCSVHADCSDRCSKWQGKVYSLDGSTGYTTDGKRYQPLSNATDIYYTTKAGRTYKNGLLGFNCRHKLYEYKAGMTIPSVSKKEQSEAYSITLKQREMERSVIKAREKALMFKDIDKAEYSKWRQLAVKRYNAYKEFSKTNKRAYYPDRVKIL